jgi:hypothetical protein
MSYYKPTPIKWRKIGDAILLGTASISTMMMGAPFSDKTISITIWALGVVGVAGKILTNFFKEDDTETNTLTNDPTKVQ